MIFHRIYNATQIEHVIYSVVMPVYNQEALIVKNVKSIIENTCDNFEIILILDFCFDDTKKNLMEFLLCNDDESWLSSNDNLVQITVFENTDLPLFETKCDNIGFRHALGTFCLEVQADMTMTQKGYNIQLAKPFVKHDNVIAVSGRCAHNLFRPGGAGKLGTDIEKQVCMLNVDPNTFYVYETCNRGPLLLHRAKLEELGFLDEENYFLDDSDHDLMARAFLEKGYICGYVPIDFSAPLDAGSTRNNSTYGMCKEYTVNRDEKERLQKKEKHGIDKYKDIFEMMDREPCQFPV